MTKNYSAAEVRQKWKQREAAIGWTELREVNLGAVIDGQRYIGAGGTQVWVTEQGRSAYKVERGDANVPDAFGRLVVVGIAPGRTYVQLFTGAGGSNGNPTAPTPGGTIAHAPQHELVQRWRQDFRGGDGVDPAFLWQHQVKDLLVEPESGFTCRVNAGWASVNGTDVYVPDGSFFTVDSGQVPAGAGDAVICRVELDDAGVFQLSYGTDYAEPVTPQTALGNAPAADTTRNTLAFIWIPASAGEIKRNYTLPTALHVRSGGGSGSGVEDFIDLGDVPSSYSGQAGNIPMVNVTEDGLEFVTPSSVIPGTLVYERWDVDAPPASSNANDDEFEGAVSGSWTDFDHGSTMTYAADPTGKGVRMVFAQIATEISGLIRAAPVGDFSMVTHLHASTVGANRIAGLMLMDGSGSSDDFYIFLISGAAAGSDQTLQVHYYTDYNSFSASLFSHQVGGMGLTLGCFLRVRRVSTTYFFDFSMDGRAWVEINSNALSNIASLDFIGIGGASNNAAAGDLVVSYDFFRVSTNVDRDAPVSGQMVGIYAPP